MKQIVIPVVALIAGAGLGYAAHAPSCSALVNEYAQAKAKAKADQVIGADFAKPSEAEATGAVRRYSVHGKTYPRATLTLGSCTPGAYDGAEAACPITVTLSPGDRPQSHSVGLRRAGGGWEVVFWN